MKNSKSFSLSTLYKGVNYLLGIIILIFLSGCAANSPKKILEIPGVSTPSAYYSKLDEVPSNENWIKEISKDKNLGNIISAVLENNTDLQKAANNVKRAASRAKITASNRYPKFAAGVGGQRNQQAFLGLPFGDADPQLSRSLFNAYGLSLDMNWEIDLWGRIKAGQEANIAEYEATFEELQSFRSSLAGQTAKIWFGILGAEQQVALASSSLESFKETSQLIQDAYESGNGRASQVYLASSDVKVASALLSERKAQSRAAARQLEILMGSYSKSNIKISGVLPLLPAPPPPGIPSDLLFRRSDLRAAERKLAASNRRIKEARLALLPQISLTSGAGTATESLKYIADTTAGIWNIAGQTGAPIFRGGEVLANLKIRKVNQSDAELDYQNAFLKALKDVETCLDNEVVLKSRWDAMNNAKVNLIKSYERALAEYKNGIGTSMNLLLTQRQMLSVSSQVLELERLRLDNRINLHLSLGGTLKIK
ncbi:MAG: hypothetical protein CMO54_08745 [Verrucomicrobiales bacterium]|nr:hypothetical protein [Verrucomicrobiales bacterium]